MDEIEWRIRAARPVSGHRDLPLSDRAKRELAELLVISDSGRVRRVILPSVRRTAIWAAVAVIMVVVAVSSTVVFQPTRVWAATPPLLRATPVAGTATELLSQLADAAAASGDPAPTGDVHIAFQEWALQIEYDAKVVSTTVVPHEYSIDRRADGGWRTTVTAGPALKYSDSAAGGDTPPEGTMLWRDDYRPGEYEPLFPRPFPVASAEVGPYFLRLVGLGTPLDADAAFLNLPQVLREQVLSGVQRAAALHYLATLPGIDVVGKVTDRLGRAGIMFRTTRTGDPDTLDYLIVAPESGRILAAEAHYVGHDRADIHSPSVTSYVAWK